MPYSYPCFRTPTVRPTQHDATNVVIEEAEQEISVRLAYWKPNNSKINHSVDISIIECAGRRGSRLSPITSASVKRVQRTI